MTLLMRHLDSFLSDSERILGLVTLNVTLAALEHGAVRMQFILGALVQLSQFAVGVATVIFIVKKARKMDREEREAWKQSKRLDPDEGD